MTRSKVKVASAWKPLNRGWPSVPHGANFHPLPSDSWRWGCVHCWWVKTGWGAVHDVQWSVSALSSPSTLLVTWQEGNPDCCICPQKFSFCRTQHSLVLPYYQSLSVVESSSTQASAMMKSELWHGVTNSLTRHQQFPCGESTNWST